MNEPIPPESERSRVTAMPGYDRIWSAVTGLVCSAGILSTLAHLGVLRTVLLFVPVMTVLAVSGWAWSLEMEFPARIGLAGGLAVGALVVVSTGLVAMMGPWSLAGVMVMLLSAPPVVARVTARLQRHARPEVPGHPNLQELLAMRAWLEPRDVSHPLRSVTPSASSASRVSAVSGTLPRTSSRAPVERPGHSNWCVCASHAWTSYDVGTRLATSGGWRRTRWARASRPRLSAARDPAPPEPS